MFQHSADLPRRMVSPRLARVSWSDPRIRSAVWQIVVVAGAASGLVAIGWQTASNLHAKGIASGFAYLGRTAGFEISQGPLRYSGRDTYARALVVGVANTLRVSVLGIVAATVLGVVIGIARLSRIWVIGVLASTYVELARNTPLLLQLFFWYTLSQALPDVHHAIRPIADVYLTQRGVFFPTFGWSAAHIVLDRPHLVRFGFEGGGSVSPEFAALFVGLSTFTAAFLAEIVRGGIVAVDRGQSEAAAALGLTRRQVLRRVVLPQALRVMIPPATSQYLNLLKNSSLAIAIGFPDLIAVTSTTLNQTGQAVEAIAVAMAAYLVISLAVAAGMSRYNALVLAPLGRRR